MRILPLIALVLICLVASTGSASDVVYKLDEKIFARPEASISIQPGGITIADRAWAAPGVEQTSKELLPPISFDFTAGQRIRIVHSWDPEPGPGWLDDVAWPLTRELYSLGLPFDGGDYSFVQR